MKHSSLMLTFSLVIMVNACFSFITPNRAFSTHHQINRRNASKKPYVLSAVFDPSSVTAAVGILNNENVKVAFSVATFLPQPFWALLVLAPNLNITKKIMGGMGEHMCYTDVGPIGALIPSWRP